MIISSSSAKALGLTSNDLVKKSPIKSTLEAMQQSHNAQFISWGQGFSRREAMHMLKKVGSAGDSEASFTGHV